MITNSSSQTQKGFSLIELLISMSIFTAVITMAVGTLIVVIDANAKAQNSQDVMTNLNFALDSISREIRTGSGLYCSTGTVSSGIDENSVNDCPASSPGRSISIVEGGNSLTGTADPRISYRFNATDSSIERRIGTGSWLPITSNSVEITDLTFVTTNTDRTDLFQPSVTIYIEGIANDVISDLSSEFALQTTVSMRLRDIN